MAVANCGNFPIDLRFGIIFLNVIIKVSVFAPDVLYEFTRTGVVIYPEFSKRQAEMVWKILLCDDVKHTGISQIFITFSKHSLLYSKTGIASTKL